MSKIVSLGIHVLDVLGRHVNRFPPGGELDIINEIRLTVAGTAAGMSVDLAKLGGDVYAMGAVGLDESGNFIIDTLRRYGVNTDHIVRKSEVQTSCSMLPIRPNGERPVLHVLGANAAYRLEDIHWDVIASADILHFGGTYLLPGLDGPPTATILKFAKEHGVTTTLDLLVNAQPDLLAKLEPALPYIDYFMPGLDEARAICGLEKRADVIAFFLNRGVGHTVFKMGAEGSSIASLDMAEILIPAYKAQVVDSTGCGDSYCAAFIMGLTKGWDLATSGRFASAAASLVVSGLGSDAGIIDFEHTLKVMNTAETLPIAQET
ncbi:putative sugar kinase [Yersinia pseudotuberculosis]|uniref:sugar kinase n=1 Tax=Yersinia pseudotuberculosis TaxID=633 RepID=UPI0005E30ECC|nr:sugar kinase [Yersinia pseudotuberculosis]CNC16744.1 putative sugar kinase [Yersinia pseudotuberculosis]CNK78052.1 putative sugar kinase [Yersinia pseudotuberculosis]